MSYRARNKVYPIFKQKMNGNKLIYFDNGATTQKPWYVIEAMAGYYAEINSNVHRSLNPLAEAATVAYENSRKVVAEFINANADHEIVFTRNTTESLNLIAKSWGRKFLKKGDIVVLSITEHHANLVPWLQLKKEIGIELKYIPLTKEGKLDVDIAIDLLNDSRAKVLSIQHISNTLGIIHPLEKLISLAKHNGLMVVVDAAQSIAHIPTDVQSLGCDFFVFSGHKMYGPTGIGVLWGKRKHLESMPEWMGGGDMIHEVYKDHYSVNDIPHKFEAGTPNIAGAIGLAAACEFILDLGWDQILPHEYRLAEYLISSMKSLDFVKIYGHTDVNEHIPTVAFSIEGVHGHDIGDLLGSHGIAIRAGHHCTQPLHDSLNITSTARVSLAVYNTVDEIDTFIKRLCEINEMFNGEGK